MEAALHINSKSLFQSSGRLPFPAYRCHTAARDLGLRSAVTLDRPFPPPGCLICSNRTSHVILLLTSRNCRTPAPSHKAKR
eukprot:5631587-Amphidinium_carterae.1